MQRLGFCKFVIMSEMHSRSGTELTKKLLDFLNTPVVFEENKKISDCVNSIPDTDKIESGIKLQYLLVCKHPSRSGWLSRLGANEYAEGLPRFLGLLDNVYRPTEFGLALRQGLIPEEEKLVLRKESFNVNPLVLSISQKVFFLYCILSIDGDFLIPFVNTLALKFGKNNFSYLDAGNLMPDILQKLLDRFSSTAYTKEDRRSINNLRNAINKIDEAIKTKLEKQGSGSRREQLTIPRLEWLIDLGFVHKIFTPESSRNYVLTEIGHSFASKFYTSYGKLIKTKYIDEALQSMLDEKYFTLIDVVYNQKQSESGEQKNIIQYLYPAYTQLKGVSGYCSVRPLLLLANSIKIESNQAIYEYNEIKKGIESLYLENQEHLYYTTTRDGSDIQVIIN